jgi:hypothetical protein
MTIRFWQLCLVGLLMTLPATHVIANVGKIIIAKGEVYAIDTAQKSRALERRSDVLEGDTLVTGANGEIQVRFNDNAILALRAGSRLKISEYHGALTDRPEQVLMELLTGGFRTITGTLGKSDKEAYQIRTPKASIGIRGTNYEAVLSGPDLVIGVYQGGVRLENELGSLNLGLDSPFSFAQVSGPQAPIQGQLVAPKALSTPLSTLSLTAIDRAENGSAEQPSLKPDTDTDLLIENLFNDLNDDLDPAPTLLVGAMPVANENVQLARQEDAPELAVTQFSAQFDLAALHDVRLTQAQIRDLSNDPNVGFVVLNEQPTGYSTARYTLAPFLATALSEDVSFDISLGTLTFAVTVSQSSAGNINAVANDINASIQSQLGQIDGVQIAAPIVVSHEAGQLIFNGVSAKLGEFLVIANLSGGDVQIFAASLGLCSNASNCTGTYDKGGVSIGQVEHATRFGYLIEGEAGPELVSFKNDKINALQWGYASPANIFRGNPNATRVDFAGVDVDGDGGNDIEWGQWNSSAANPALLLKDATNIDSADQVAAPFYYVSAIPALAASRVGIKTFGDSSVELEPAQWHANASTGQILALSAQLAVNFGTAEAVGSLSLANATDGAFWDVSYVGHLRGAQFFSDYGYGTLETATGTHSVAGQVDGLFTGSATGMGFVGGFGLQTTDDVHNAQGVFVIKN